MNREFFELCNTKIIAGMDWNTVPSDSLFAEKGKTVCLGKSPWNLEEYTGKKVDLTKCVMIRGELTVPEDGIYLFGAGADWEFQIILDGTLVRSGRGNYPPTVSDHEFFLKLTAGKHIIDLKFSRGNRLAAMAFEVSFCPEITNRVDLTLQTGRLRKELHGANVSLPIYSRGIHQYEMDLKKLNFTFSRTHDWALVDNGERVIDTHFIFPLMKLDPKDPSNYYFDATDEAIRLVQDAGMEIFYRLGSSIEHSGKKHFNVLPPEDPEKYAEVLTGIIRHYTRGWANGFHYNIRYWEIWNEPQGQEGMWPAPFETFIPFFVTVLKRLKSEFPELMIGGPASVGTDVEAMRQLLEACKAAGIAPDFLSWHRYCANPKFFLEGPAVMRKLLDDTGFPDTKLCLDEWHYLETWNGIESSADPETYRKAIAEIQGINSGVYNLAVLAGMQETVLDLAMYYGCSWDWPAWGFRNAFHEFTKNYYSMELFGTFLKEYQIKCKSESFVMPYLLAARSEDGKKAGILIADYKDLTDELRVRVSGLEDYPRISALILDEDRNNEAVPVEIQGDVLLLKKKPGSAAYLIRLEK